jgi:hypothetical protein
MHRETIIVSTDRIFKGVPGKIIAFGPSQAASLSRIPAFLPLRFAHSAKIRSSAATPVIDLVHRLFPDRFQSFRSVEGAASCATTPSRTNFAGKSSGCDPPLPGWNVKPFLGA